MLHMLILHLIKLGRTEGLREKLEVFSAVGDITEERYSELLAKLEDS